MRPRYKYVLLDADNTLFDFDEAERRSLDRSLLRRGVTPTEALRQRYLAINRPFWEALHRREVTQEFLVVERFRLFGAELGLACDPAEWNREYLAGLGECAALLPGAEDLLKALAPHCVLALATNGVAHVQRARLKGCPIAPYFGDRVFISGEMGLAKPEKEYFDKIRETLGAERSETVMIGDTLGSDIQGAANGGLDRIWYDPAGRTSELATYAVARLEDIPPIILGGSV